MIYKHQTKHGTAARAVAWVCRFPDSATFKVRTNNRLHLILSLLLILSTFGCSMVSGKRHTDGRIVITSWRFLWKSEAIDFTTTATNFSARLRIGKSNSDEAAVGAVTEGAVKALTRP